MNKKKNDIEKELEKKDKIPQKKPKKINEFAYFALRNTKLKVGLSVVLFFLVVAIIGPFFTDYKWNAYIGPISQPPSSEYWMGTTTFGQDVYTQFVEGLRASFIVGIIGGGIATLIGIIIGFTAGYRGGMVDEALNIITNIVLVIPTFALLLIIAAYLKVRGILMESVFIGFTAWPWAARAIRAQTFSLRSREFVDLARISGMKSYKIIFTEIAPNMMSYLLMTFILQFGGAILIAATLDFIGLGPTNAVSLGLMMNYAVLWGALEFGIWWWFVPPGLAIMLIVGSLYIMNVGLDEVFNPKLREM
jgi:peptide/nickel transport system permease protein